MSKANLIVGGNIHQADRRFSDVSRGRQCAFMSLSALLRANSSRVSQWTSHTVDQVLVEGDAMYLKAFDDGTIPDAETLSLTSLPDRVRWPKMTVDPTEPNQSPITLKKTDLKPSSQHFTLPLVTSSFRQYK